MKNLLFIPSLFLILFCAAQPGAPKNKFLFPQPLHGSSRSASPLLDSTVTWQWNTATSAFDMYEDENYFGYDSSGNNIFFQEDTGSWVPFLQDSIYYNGQNQITSQFSQFWMGTDWENGGISYYQYNGQNLLDSIYSESWDGSSYELFAVVYNTYATDNTIRSTTQWIDYGGWFPVLLDTFTYDAHHNVLTDLTFDWSGSVWQNYSLTEYTYNVDNVATGALMQAWTIEGWYPSGKVINNFDVYGNVISAIDSDYTDNLVDSIHYYYQGTTAGLTELANPPITVSVYPNPANSAINVSFANPVAHGTVMLFDMTGRALLTQPINSNPQRLNTSNLAASVYEILIADEVGNKVVKQVIIQ